MNTGFFVASNHRRTKKPVIDYNLINNSNHTYRQTAFVHSARSIIEPPYMNETFLPTLSIRNGLNDGNRPYRRNDFANNHLFIAKQRLARLFLDQPTTKVDSTTQLINLFDSHEPKQKQNRINKIKRQQIDTNSDCKSNTTNEHDSHVSVVNLILKPSLRTPWNRDSYGNKLQYRFNQTKRSHSSHEWINPADKMSISSTLNQRNENISEINTIITESIDNTTINNTLNNQRSPIEESILSVKSIIPLAAQRNCR